MRIAHFVSAFPVLSETFVREEMAAFAKSGFSNVVVALRISPEDFPPSEIAQHYGPLRIETLLEPHYSLSAAAKGFFSGPAASAKALFPMVLSGLGNPWELPKQALTAWRFLEVLSNLRELKVDVCHAHFAHYPATLAWACAHALEVPFTFNAHSYDLFKYRAHLSRKIRDAAAVFPISDRNRLHLLRSCGRLLGPKGDPRVEVIHCGIRLEDYPLRESPGLVSNAPPWKVLGVGRLVDTKGFHTLVEAIGRLCEWGIGIQAEIVGEGPERENLKDLIHRLGLQDHVRLTGALSHAETLEKQRVADVAVQPCGPGKNGLDGIPVVLMEAMALGVPVVSTRFAGIPELIETDRSGLLVPAGDSTALAEAVASLLSSPARASQMALAARDTVEREFDAGKNYREKAERIKTLVNQGN